MGCDIHLHIEVKIGGKWEHWGSPDVPRNYALFALMADVRNDGTIKPICQPKGLPKDIHLLTKLDYNRAKSDYHGMSWFGVDEIIELNGILNNAAECREFFQRSYICLEIDILKTWLFRNTFASFREYPKSYPSVLKDVRFVFWFDS